jgi:hypothetical protein
MRLPLEIAMEVGSFLDEPSLTVCTTQLCWSGVGFVSRPCTDSANETTIQLHNLIPLCHTASRRLAVGQEQSNSHATKAIKRINLCLARRTSAEKVVFVANVTEISDTDIYSDIRRHFQVSSNLKFENGPSLAVEWHARAGSIDAVAFLLGQSLHTLDLSYSYVIHISALASCQALHTLRLNDTRVNDVSALAACQALHTLFISGTPVSDVSALAACQALHTLRLNVTPVSDVSALAACQALHTLNLYNTQVHDVSALVACGSLRDLRCGQNVLGYEAVASLIQNRRLQAQGV